LDQLDSPRSHSRNCAHARASALMRTDPPMLD
jgi:hypothetical protein